MIEEYNQEKKYSVYIVNGAVVIGKTFEKDNVEIILREFTALT